MVPVSGPYLGLTWEHPRGTNALRAGAVEAQESSNALSIRWDAHSLEGFESSPIGNLAAKYDLLVIDHPHLGDAISQEAILPLDTLLPEAVVSDLKAHSVGPSFRAYQAEGRLWALPLDAATQVAVVRGDLAEDLPTTWDQVLALSSRAPVALSLAGPHAFLSLCSIMVALGAPPRSLPPRPRAEDLLDATAALFDRDAGIVALGLLHQLAVRVPKGSSELNPIGLLERMRDERDIAYIPLIYGYVNYASMPVGGTQLRFLDAPSIDARGNPGSTIGGTGIAISAHTDVSPELLKHLCWLLSESAQRDFIPRHAGQPSRDSAWKAEDLNAASGSFYKATRRTMDASWVRPRFPGYTRFQSEASEIIRQSMRAVQIDPPAVLARIELAYRAACERAAESITTGVHP